MAHSSQLKPQFHNYYGHKALLLICFMHLESLQDLSRIEALAHEDPILMLVYLLAQEIDECARHNL
jgi:hypothetical protein